MASDKSDSYHGVQMRVYGPYKRNDGRSHVILIDDKGNRRTVSYPKYIMEQHLGRELDPDKETIDHINGDFTNNNLSNLRVIDRSNHIKDDIKRVRLGNYVCPQCGKKFQSSCNDVDHNRKQGCAGPFCCRSCAGKYGTDVQNNRTTKLKPFPLRPKRRYYTRKELLDL